LLSSLQQQPQKKSQENPNNIEDCRLVNTGINGNSFDVNEEKDANTNYSTTICTSYRKHPSVSETVTDHLSMKISQPSTTLLKHTDNIFNV